MKDSHTMEKAWLSFISLPYIRITLPKKAMKLIENLNYFVKVVGGGKEFYVHSTVKSVIKEKDMETISTICLWKMKRKKGLKHQKCWDQTIPPTSFNTLRIKESL